MYARKAQNKTKLDPMVGLFVTVFVNNAVNAAAMIIRHFVWQPVPIYSAGVAFFVFGGVLNSFMGRGLLFVSVSMLGAARAGLTKAMVPVFAILGGVLALGEQLARSSWIGIGILLLGLFLMSFEAARRDASVELSAAGSKNARNHFIKGIGFGLLAALFLGSGNVFRKAGIAIIPDTVLAVSLTSFFALAACVLTLLFQRKGAAMISAVKNMEFNYAASGLFTSGALYTLFMSMRHIPISIANSISATEPLFTIFFVWLLKESKREKLGAKTVFFGIIMAAGTIVLIIN